MKILSGDIGGTKTRLALFETDGKALQVCDEKSFESRSFKALEEIVEAFADSRSLFCERACFGIAGPVKDGRVRTTNLPWVVESRKISQELGIQKVSLINDLVANAYGIDALAAEDFFVLREGRAAEGNAAVISAGTGLGEAGLYWDGGNHTPFASEGGHTNFAPSNEMEIVLLKYLATRFGHVSWERVLSGPGLVNIHQFLTEYKQAKPSREHEEAMHAGDPAVVITQTGLSGQCKICSEALDLFVSLYGSEAGNLALKMMATGGVYLGGGIAPKILERLKGKTFLSAFLEKGRMRKVLEQIPVKVILNDKAALLGAARCAVLDQKDEGVKTCSH